MKCSNCGFENKDKAKFCTKCGNSLSQPPVTGDGSEKSTSSKYVIIALCAVILILVGTIGYFAFTMNSNPVQVDDNSQNTTSQDDNLDNDLDNDSSSETTKSVQTTKTKTKSWESIGSYSGSGSGSQTISVPSGEIMVKLSAYPIKNYATNHLYVTGPSGAGGVDWGSTSDVETRSDSFTFTSSSTEQFTIDYYETVSWEVEFFRYQ